MTHRYLRPAWWVSRLAGEAERFTSPRRTTAALAWAAMRAGERELRRLEEWVPGDRLALDVGADRGLYTWRLAHLARQVHAFEPQPDLAARLRIAVSSDRHRARAVETVQALLAGLDYALTPGMWLAVHT